jgi:hypothetical protein
MWQIQYNFWWKASFTKGGIIDRSYENKKDPEGWCAIKLGLMMTCIIVSQSQIFHHDSF